MLFIFLPNLTLVVTLSIFGQIKTLFTFFTSLKKHTLSWPAAHIRAASEIVSSLRDVPWKVQNI